MTLISAYSGGILELRCRSGKDGPYVLNRVFSTNRNFFEYSISLGLLLGHSTERDLVFIDPMSGEHVMTITGLDGKYTTGRVTGGDILFLPACRGADSELCTIFVIDVVSGRATQKIHMEIAVDFASINADGSRACILTIPFESVGEKELFMLNRYRSVLRKSIALPSWYGKVLSSCLSLSNWIAITVNAAGRVVVFVLEMDFPTS